jgi:hypothetical protein
MLRCVVVGGDLPTSLFRCVRPGRCAWLGLFRRACELDRRSRMRPPSPLYPLRSAWQLRSAFFSMRVGVLRCVIVGETLRPSYFAALGLAAALGFLMRIGVLRCTVVGGDLRTSLFRCARPGCCVRLGLLRRACELVRRSRESPDPPFPDALSLAAALGFLMHLELLRCVVVEGDLPTFLFRYARPGRCAWLGLLRRACDLNRRSRARPPNLLIRCAQPGRCAWLSFLCAWA